MANWKPIAEAMTDPRVTGEQRTIFVGQFRDGAYPSYNCVYYDWLPPTGATHPWKFADGGGAYHKDWPTHWMFADEVATIPAKMPDDWSR